MSAVTASLDRAGTAARPGVPAVPADDVLVVGLRLRDENAYLELVRRHTPLMLRVDRSILGNAKAAEDVVRDTWVAVLRSIDGLEGRSTFKTWLMRILVNTARRTALSGLPDRQRVVVVLRDVEGSTSEEVRALLGPDAVGAVGA